MGRVKMAHVNERLPLCLRRPTRDNRPISTYLRTSCPARVAPVANEHAMPHAASRHTLTYIGGSLRPHGASLLSFFISITLRAVLSIGHNGLAHDDSAHLFAAGVDRSCPLYSRLSGMVRMPETGD